MLDLQFGLLVSVNSCIDIVYYSLVWDFVVIVVLVVDYMFYQCYDIVWSQQLLVGGGSYW